MSRRLAFALCLCAALPAVAETLIDTRFGENTVPVAILDNRAPELRVSGSVPKGWADNSGWARVWGTYTPQREPAGSYLRVAVSKVENGRMCLCFQPLPDLPEESYFRLAGRFRSSSRMMVTLSVRVVPSPYTSLWSESCYPSANDWSEHNYTFRVAKNTQPIGLWVYLDGIGQTDLSGLRLERITRDEALAAVKARYPEPPTGNILRNSRLPLGLQSGWNMLSSGGSAADGDVEVTPDPQVIGPSGAPALRLRLKRGAALFTDPFAPVFAPDPYCASVYVRGTGKGQLHVLAYVPPEADYRVIGYQKFELAANESWQRLTVPFQPVPFTPTGSLRFWLDPGTYWLDALQVERGDKATPYAPQRACEAALALPDGPAAVARVQFTDEPASVRFAVTTAPPGARLKSQLVTVYGETIPLKPVALTGKPLQQGELSYADALAKHPRGPVRIEAWVEQGEGQRISACNELLLQRLRRPRYWGQEAPESAFGLHLFCEPRFLTMAKSLGANWVRLHGPGSKSTDWHALENKRGEWQFCDEDIELFRQYKLSILGNLQTTPPWANLAGEKSASTWEGNFNPPADLTAFAHYVRTLVTRYKGVINEYEFWNEPYWGTQWDKCNYPARDGEGNGPLAMTNYVRLLRTAYETARSVDPQVKILGFCTNITPDRAGAAFSGSEWTTGVLAANGDRFCDGLSFHHYEPTAPFGFPGDNIDTGVGVVTQPFLTRDGRAPKDLWMTEGSPLLFTPLPNANFYNHTLAGDGWNVDPAAPGDRMARYLISLLAQDVKKVFLYSTHCHSSLLFRKLDYLDLVSMDGYPNLAASAFATTAWHLDGTTHVKTLQPAQGVLVPVFSAAGRSVATILPHPAGHAPFRLRTPEGYFAEDQFGNPIANGALLGQGVVYLTTRKPVTALEAVIARMAAPGP